MPDPELEASFRPSPDGDVSPHGGRVTGVCAVLEKIITGGHDNKTARLAIRQGETINAPALTAMFGQIIANNRAGGSRKLKRDL